MRLHTSTSPQNWREEYVGSYTASQLIHSASSFTEELEKGVWVTAFKEANPHDKRNCRPITIQMW